MCTMSVNNIKKFVMQKNSEKLLVKINVTYAMPVGLPVSVHCRTGAPPLSAANISQHSLTLYVIHITLMTFVRHTNKWVAETGTMLHSSKMSTIHN